MSPPTTLPPVEERLVRQRLRTIIQLAITIGRRESLISGEMPVDNDREHTGESYAVTLKNNNAQDSSPEISTSRSIVSEGKTD
ncbi:MAG: hypothetical protein AAC990_04105 [Dehalococcoides mccartyi]|uniref:hypothetical protein n=1 Tax=Dehalococcoides mccartyi TaxID=61435 RepID=UPI0030F5C7B6